MGTPRTWRAMCGRGGVEGPSAGMHVSTAAGDSDRRAVDAHGDPARARRAAWSRRSLRGLKHDRLRCDVENERDIQRSREAGERGHRRLVITTFEPGDGGLLHADQLRERCLGKAMLDAVLDQPQRELLADRRPLELGGDLRVVCLRGRDLLRCIQPRQLYAGSPLPLRSTRSSV
jgi:hypothetical protein